MRVVLDANVLVSALISQAGRPREIVGAWVDERFELIASPNLLDELRDVLSRPRFRRWVSLDVVAEFVDGLARDAVVVADPPAQPGLTADPDDDYLIALARATQADYVVSGDRHLLDSPTRCRRCLRHAISSTCSTPEHAARGPSQTPPTPPWRHWRSRSIRRRRRASARGCRSPATGRGRRVCHQPRSGLGHGVQDDRVGAVEDSRGRFGAAHPVVALWCEDDRGAVGAHDFDHAGHAFAVGGRNWDDMRRYGFVSAGRGDKYRKAMSNLFEGARVWASIPGTGYVGVGEVISPAVGVTDFDVEIDGQRLPILEAPLAAANMGEDAEDPEKSEYLARVRWIDTRPRDESFWEKACSRIRTWSRNYVSPSRCSDSPKSSPPTARRSADRRHITDPAGAAWAHSDARIPSVQGTRGRRRRTPGRRSSARRIPGWRRGDR